LEQHLGRQRINFWHSPTTVPQDGVSDVFSIGAGTERSDNVLVWHCGLEVKVNHTGPFTWLYRDAYFDQISQARVNNFASDLDDKL
jgi:ketopantoate hydroxymethyltransferase